MYGIEQTTALKQELSQYQLQRLEILAMSGDELSDFLEEAQNENPLVEVVRDRSAIEQEFSIARWLTARPVYGQPLSEAEGDDVYEPEISDRRGMTLEQSLRLQIDFRRFSKEQRRVLNCLLGSIEKNGRLPFDARKTAEVFGCTEADAETCLVVLRRLEPCGVCAESLRDALLRQLYALPVRCPAAETLVQKHFQSICSASAAGLAKKCGTDAGSMRDALCVLKKLDPYPGSEYEAPERQYVVPDVLFIRNGEDWEIRLCDEWCGSVNISSYYVQLLKNANDKESSSYLYERLQRAKNLKAAVEMRRETLLRISRLILERQKGFFEKGTALKPLSLSDIASNFSYHESTISRAIKNKYLACPRGTFPLRSFIVAAVGETGVTNDAIQKKLRLLIDGEDKGAPLSDQQIAERMTAAGDRISRRTVAKYRAALGIPNAFARKA